MKRAPLPPCSFFIGLCGLSLGLGLAGCTSPPTDMNCSGSECPAQTPDMRKKQGEPPADCTMPVGTARKAVVDHFAMPTVAQPCSIDIDGDGKSDNALMLVVGGLKAGFDLQATADAVVEGGELIQLLTVQSTDPANSTCAAATIQRGLPTDAPPKYDGTDSFRVNQALPTQQILGTITGGLFDTPSTKDQTTANLARGEISLPGGFGVEIPLPVFGLHLSGKVGAGGFLRGELHGAVRMKDVDGRIIPAIAQVMTTTINKAPNSPTALTLIATFETKAKCDAMPDLCCAKKPAVCQITADEVRSNKQTQAILKPDVQMFDGDRWAPNALLEKPDSMSVGLCFTAVPAQF